LFIFGLYIFKFERKVWMKKSAGGKLPEITPTMRVLMQSTICLARGSGPIPRFLLRELDHPEIQQNIDHALDNLIVLGLLKRDGKHDVYITREGYEFRDMFPADVVVWVSVCYAMCTLVQRLLETNDLIALSEVEIHLRALTNMMIRRPGIEALMLASLLAIYLHNTGEEQDAKRYAKELEALEKQLGKPQSAVVRLILYGEAPESIPLPTEHIRLAEKIDVWVKGIEKRGGGDVEILTGMYDYMPSFKTILDTSRPGDMDLLCEKYTGFYRFAKLLENLAGAIQDGIIEVPK
jgi:hypothetical protein